jgi:hypothetical protein
MGILADTPGMAGVVTSASILVNFRISARRKTPDQAARSGKLADPHAHAIGPNNPSRTTRFPHSPAHP